VTPFNERVAAQGTKFSYASGETQVLGLVLARAIGRPVAEHLEQKIWQPMGAEADATWLVDNSGQEVTFCGLKQTWILPTKRRMFILWGVRGQRIFVDPDNKLVMVNTAVHKLPIDLPPLEEGAALWFALVRQLGGGPQPSPQRE
jgi:CubicO group peptidase (beta-lactamase class C family)